VREEPPVGQRGRVRRHMMCGETADRAFDQPEKAEPSCPWNVHVRLLRNERRCPKEMRCCVISTPCSSPRRRAL
jgi:hypothetical protein